MTSDRVLAVLELFDETHSSWSVEEAAQAIGLPVSTTYRYFRSLTKSELLIADLPGRYVLGPAIIRFDRQIRLHDPLIQAAKGTMRDLAAEIGGANEVLLARLYHSQVMCVHVESSGDLPNTIGYERGKPIALDRGAGSKAILAFLPPRLVRILARSENGDAPLLIVSDALKRELRLIRAQEYSITVGEIAAGFRGVAVPVFGPGQNLEGSLSIAAPSDRQDIAEMLTALVRARKAVEANLAMRVFSGRLNSRL